jgi:single-strand DNA-binding protein
MTQQWRSMGGLFNADAKPMTREEELWRAERYQQQMDQLERSRLEMSSYNRVILLANLTREPQIRYTPSGSAVADFGVATNRKWHGQDGQERSEVCFVDCTMFGKRAETIQKFFHKGTPIFIEGRLTFESWQAQDGGKRSKLKITVENFEFVGTGGQRSGDAQAEPESQEDPGAESQGDGEEAPF